MDHKNFSIPEPTADRRRDIFCFVSVIDDVSVIGCMVSSDDSWTRSIAMYSLADQSWTELDLLSGPRISSSVARGRFPLDVLHCHQHCPLFTAKGDDDVHLGQLSEYGGDGDDCDSWSDDYDNGDDEYGDYDEYLDHVDEDNSYAVDYLYCDVVWIKWSQRSWTLLPFKFYTNKHKLYNLKAWCTFWGSGIINTDDITRTNY